MFWRNERYQPMQVPVSWTLADPKPSAFQPKRAERRFVRKPPGHGYRAAVVPPSRQPILLTQIHPEITPQQPPVAVPNAIDTMKSVSSHGRDFHPIGSSPRLVAWDSICASVLSCYTLLLHRFLLKGLEHGDGGASGGGS